MIMYGYFPKHADLQAKTCVHSREDKVVEYVEEEMFFSAYAEIWEFPS